MTLHMGDDRDADLAARERAVDNHDLAAKFRQDMATARETALEQREAHIEALLTRALDRDQLAERRDRRAEQRDRAAEGRATDSPEESARAAAADRGQSAMDRYQAGVDRDLSAGDRADQRGRATIRSQASRFWLR